MKFLTKAAIAGTFFLFGATLAHAEEKFTYNHAVYKEKSVPQPDGSVKRSLEKAKSALPGEELTGILKYEYNHEVEAKNVVFKLPLKKEFAYVEGSATDEKYVWFSADGGKTFSRMKDLRITLPSGGERPATANDITHLEWRMAQPVRKGEKGELKYRIVIR